ncbi:AraC family transcriptional regulator [Duganella callida]|uniref:AraC family transcriptional regulator n=1 Tax=Duganella callida TaxID=2561932 RepID=A0A4Y9S1X3_9BURK|nr:AraC family transcriptional regulator [Duganella callida]TFW13919.1 AraC family transcriptional regulator [Duganella callida]
MKELAAAILQYTDTQPGENPWITGIDGLMLLRSNHERQPAHLVLRPSLCVVAQGAKWTMFGNQRYDYAVGQALLVGVEMPALGRVVEASPQAPFLGMVIGLDLAVMREVLESLGEPPAPVEVERGALVAEFDGPLADCALRMMRLLHTPKAVPLLQPAIMREICYWLLTGPYGGAVARLALAEQHGERVMHAIHALRLRFAEAVRIDDLARIAQLSPSAFHRKFKALTSMTPLQYQKRLRLLEARRLIAANAANAETAAFQVGYESPSQFSREYARMFGAPPRRDIAALRALAA